MVVIHDLIQVFISLTRTTDDGTGTGVLIILSLVSAKYYNLYVMKLSCLGNFHLPSQR